MQFFTRCSLQAFGISVFLASCLGSAVQASAGQHAKPFPYELAFGNKKFRDYDPPTLSVDGKLVAYTVVTPPEVTPQGGRVLPNGTPVSAIGAKIHVSHIDAPAAVHSDPVCGEAGNQWEPTWSPDGQHLGLFSDADGRPHLWLYSVSDGTCRKVSDVVIRASGFLGYRAQWAPDGRTIYVPVRPDPPLSLSDAIDVRDPATRARPEGGVSAPHVFRSGSEVQKEDIPVDTAFGDEAPFMLANYNATWTAIDVGTGIVRNLIDARVNPRPAVARVSPTGRWLSVASVAYRSKDGAGMIKDLSLVPTGGGPPKPLAQGLASSNAGVNYGELDYRWHPLKDQLVYVHDGRVWVVDVNASAAGRPRELAGDVGPAVAPVLYFTRGGRAVIVGVDPDGEGRLRRPAALAVAPMEGGKTIHLPLPDKAKWQFVDIIRADDHTAWQPDLAFVHVLMRERSTAEQAVYRIDLAGGPPERIASGLVQYRNFRSAGDHETLIAIFEDASTAPDLQVLAGDMQPRKRVSMIEPAALNYPLGGAEVIESRVPVYDGTMQSVRTTLLLPVGAKRGDKLPAIVMIYSGADLSTQATQYGGGRGNTVPNQVFTSRGYAVVMANIVLSPDGEPGNPLQDMVDALLPQLYALAGSGYIDIERLAISGQSYGGYSTAAIVSQTNLFRAAIPVNGKFDLAGGYAHMDAQGESNSIRWSEQTQGRMGEPLWANPLRYVNNSPYYRVDRIHTPMLIIAGEKDRTVPPEQSQMLFVGLRRLDRPSQLLMYPDQGHSIMTWSTASAADAARRMVEFLDKHLGVTDQSSP